MSVQDEFDRLTSLISQGVQAGVSDADARAAGGGPGTVEALLGLLSNPAPPSALAQDAAGADEPSDLFNTLLAAATALCKDGSAAGAPSSTAALATQARPPAAAPATVLSPRAALLPGGGPPMVLGNASGSGSAPQLRHPSLVLSHSHHQQQQQVGPPQSPGLVGPPQSSQHQLEGQQPEAGRPGSGGGRGRHVMEQQQHQHHQQQQQPGGMGPAAPHPTAAAGSRGPGPAGLTSGRSSSPLTPPWAAAPYHLQEGHQTHHHHHHPHPPPPSAAAGTGRGPYGGLSHGSPRPGATWAPTTHVPAHGQYPGDHQHHQPLPGGGAGGGGSSSGMMQGSRHPQPYPLEGPPGYVPIGHLMGGHPAPGRGDQPPYGGPSRGAPNHHHPHNSSSSGYGPGVSPNGLPAAAAGYPGHSLDLHPGAGAPTHHGAPATHPGDTTVPPRPGSYAYPLGSIGSQLQGVGLPPHHPYHHHSQFHQPSHGPLPGAHMSRPPGTHLPMSASPTAAAAAAAAAAGGGGAGLAALSSGGGRPLLRGSSGGSGPLLQGVLSSSGSLDGRPGSGREHKGSSAGAKVSQLVVVWDLDETLGLLHSLLDGRWAAAHPGADPEEVAAVGRQWARLGQQIVERHLGWEQLQHAEYSHISDALHGHQLQQRQTAAAEQRMRHRAATRAGPPTHQHSTAGAAHAANAAHTARAAGAAAAAGATPSPTGQPAAVKQEGGADRPQHTQHTQQADRSSSPVMETPGGGLDVSHNNNSSNSSRRPKRPRSEGGEGVEVRQGATLPPPATGPSPAAAAAAAGHGDVHGSGGGEVCPSPTARLVKLQRLDTGPAAAAGGADGGLSTQGTATATAAAAAAGGQAGAAQVQPGNSSSGQQGPPPQGAAAAAAAEPGGPTPSPGAAGANGGGSTTVSPAAGAGGSGNESDTADTLTEEGMEPQLARAAQGQGQLQGEEGTPCSPNRPTQPPRAKPAAAGSCRSPTPELPSISTVWQPEHPGALAAEGGAGGAGGAGVLAGHQAAPGSNPAAATSSRSSRGEGEVAASQQQQLMAGSMQLLLLRPGCWGPSGGELVAGFRQLMEAYSRGLSGMRLSSTTRDLLSLLRGRSAALTHNWLGCGSALLAGLAAGGAGPPVTHVLVSGDHLVTLAGKLLMWNFSERFPLENVYAVGRATKLHCFKRVAARFGKEARYCVIGDGLEEEVAARSLSWPFLRITLTDPGSSHISADMAASTASPVLPCSGDPAAAWLVQQQLDDSGSLGRPLPLLRPQMVFQTALAGGA